MLTKFGRCLLALIGVWACAIAQADDRQQIEDSLNATYKGKVFILRNFYRGNRLTYNSDGKLINGGPTGPWTADGSVRVKHIGFRPDRVEVVGNRLVLAYCEAIGFRSLAAGKIRIEIQVKPDPTNLDASRILMGRVFVGTDEKLIDLVPAYWKPFLSGEDNSAVRSQNKRSLEELLKDLATDLDREGLEKVGGNVSAPIPTHKPEPPYTEEARAADLQGTVVLWVIVNAEGKVKEVRLVKPLGGGLDGKAMETVSAWKFKPAIRNGISVPVRVLVEIAFRLH